VGRAARVARTGAIAGFPGADAVNHDTFYRIPTDLFIPAALERMVNEDIARKLKTRVVVEAANGPTTAGAELILLERGIDILPAILCNSGGVTVSYFEWVQNRNNESWTLDHVDGLLRRYINEMCDRVRRTRERYQTDMRMAAYIVALDRIRTVYNQRGIFPDATSIRQLDTADLKFEFSNDQRQFTGISLNPVGAFANLIL
jgi:glutamate dehydrogenase (NAD(P)+)